MFKKNIKILPNIFGQNNFSARISFKKLRWVQENCIVNQITPSEMCYLTFFSLAFQL